MLRKRIIFVLTFLDGVLFRTRNFKPDYRYTHNFVDSWSVDEIVILDISRSKQSSRKIFLDRVKAIARDCFVPLTVGGGIRTVEDIEMFLRSGADKVVLNSGALENPELINEAVSIFGSQCITISIDSKLENGEYYVYKNHCAESTSLKLLSWINEVQLRGVGEILIQNYEKDGTLEGYDWQQIKLAREKTSVPLIACSGAGNWTHFEKALSLNVDGVATTNIYHFTETAINSAKNYLLSKGHRMREIFNER